MKYNNSVIGALTNLPIETEKLGKQILTVLDDVPLDNQTCGPILHVLQQTSNLTDNIFDDQAKLLTKVQNTTLDARQQLFNVTVNLNFTKSVDAVETEMSAYPGIFNRGGDVYGNRSTKAVLLNAPNPRKLFFTIL